MRLNPTIDGLSPYDPKYMPAQVLLSANESPLGLPEKVWSRALERVSNVALNRYPDPLATELRGLIADNLPAMLLPSLAEGSAARAAVPAVEPSRIVLGNGGDELLFDLFLAWGGQGSSAVVCSPTFSVYGIDASLTGTEIVEVDRNPDFSLDVDALIERISGDANVSIVIVTTPNNPSGDIIDEQSARRVLESTDALVILDEAYGEFSETTLVHLTEEYPNLAILRTFSKAYSLAGARLGYMIASEEVVAGVLTVRQPYSVDAISQAIGCAVCENVDLFGPRVLDTIRRRILLTEKLSCITGVEVFPSRANYIMIRIKSAEEVWRRMVDDYGVLVRNLTSGRGLEGCLRLTVGTEAENESMLDSLASAIMKAM